MVRMRGGEKLCVCRAHFAGARSLGGDFGSGRRILSFLRIPDLFLRGAVLCTDGEGAVEGGAACRLYARIAELCVRLWRFPVGEDRSGGGIPVPDGVRPGRSSGGTALWSGADEACVSDKKASQGSSFDPCRGFSCGSQLLFLSEHGKRAVAQYR